MTTLTDLQPTIVRTERGLTLSGTRITIYDILEYIQAGWPPKLIRDRLQLTDDQLDVAIAYIHVHPTEVEAEYQAVLENAQEIRRSWDERNHDRLAQIAHMPSQPGQEALRAKITAWKHRLESVDDHSR